MADKKDKKDTGEQSLKDTMKGIREKFGEDAIMMLDEKPNVDVESLPTGSLGLDLALGIGGYPRGRIVEIFGPESSGKTTMALHAVAEAQKKGWECAFIDAEHSMDPQYAKKLGVDTSKLLISQPSCGEEAMQIADHLVQGGKVKLIVVDSVAALTPRAEIEGEIGDIKVGALARLMSQSMRMLTGSIHKQEAIIIFINQIRMNIGMMGFGANPETTAGGKALKFYASVRVDVRKINTIKKGEDAVGSRVKLKVVKNKVAAPFKQTELDILFNEGVSPEGELLAMGEKYGVLTRSASGYSLGEVKVGRGYDAARTHLKENPELREKIKNLVLEKAKEQ